MRNAPTMQVRFPDKIKYRGSASKESYKTQNKDWSTAEGESFEVDYKGPALSVLKDIEGGLKSAFAYVGAEGMWKFHRDANLIHVSPNTQILNGAHGK